jgi:hypothetical protein
MFPRPPNKEAAGGPHFRAGLTCEAIRASGTTPGSSLWVQSILSAIYSCIP